MTLSRFSNELRTPIANLLPAKASSSLIGPAPAAATPAFFDTEQMHRALIISFSTRLKTRRQAARSRCGRNVAPTHLQLRVSRHAGRAFRRHPRASVRAVRDRTQRRNRPGAGDRARDRARPWRRRAACTDKRGRRVRDRGAMANILIVDDDAALRDGLAETVADLGHEPRVPRRPAARLCGACRRERSMRAARSAHAGGMDGIEVCAASARRTMPPPVIVLTAFATAENTIEAMRLGAFDHLTKPIGREELDALSGATAGRGAALQPAATAGETSTLIGSSEAMRRVQKTIGLAADSDATVLILGETGTGKELVARALHRARRAQEQSPSSRSIARPSPRTAGERAVRTRERRLHRRHRGSRRRFSRSRSGTLFLDEIGDMPAPMQGKILRAIEERVVTPVGGKPRPLRRPRDRRDPSRPACARGARRVP